MRRFRLIVVGFVALLGALFMWRQFVQRRPAARQGGFAPEAFSPVWPASAPIGESSPTRTAATNESSAKQNNIVPQPQEPAAAPAPQTSAAVPDADLWSEPPAESDAAPDTNRDTAITTDSDTATDTDSETARESDGETDHDTTADTEPEAVSESDGETETTRPDDLIEIEGIGPKISTIVYAAGITTFAELAGAEVGRLEAILHEAGIHTANPSTWPKQADLAAQGKWDELKQLQDRIKNGRLEA